jgi:Major Facilitator Superfamily
MLTIPLAAALRHDGKRCPVGGGDRNAVSAAFILISSKVGDLVGRKRAFCGRDRVLRRGDACDGVRAGLDGDHCVLGGAGGLGASLYLPAMQLLIHGNFEGKARAKVFALVGASAAIAAAVGPLLGGFVPTLVSWRVGFLIEALIIAVVLVGSPTDP